MLPTPARRLARICGRALGRARTPGRALARAGGQVLSFIPSAAVIYFVTAAACAPARADLVSSGPTGFQLRYTVSSPMPATAAYERFIAIGRWWSDEHTYSGRASALSIEPTPGGCWCEKLPDRGGVRHMTVGYVAPGKTILLEGGLGPLLSMGVHGALAVSFKPREAGSEIVATYNVSGYAAPGEMEKMAVLVEKVLAEQFERFAAQR